MQFDWTAAKPGWDLIPGETHLLIVPNSEHSLATGVPELVSSVTAFFASIAAREEARPTFTWSRDATSGALTVTLSPGSPAPSKVLLRHAQTSSSTRRDFRWVRLAGANGTAKCSLLHGEISIKPIEGGGNCVVPMVWHGVELQPALSSTADDEATLVESRQAAPTAAASAPLTFTATPPQPTKPGHYTGYYLELFFPSKHVKGKLQVSTPGFVWPDKLPYPDCDFASCPLNLL